MRTEWEVHTAVFIKTCHPELAKAEMCHCASYGKFLRSGPWEGSAWGGVGVSVSWGVCSSLPAEDRSWERGGTQLLQLWGLLHRLPFRFPYPSWQNYLLLRWLWIPGGATQRTLGFVLLLTEALSLLGISGMLLLRQSLQKHVLLIDCQNVWSFFP